MPILIAFSRGSKRLAGAGSLSYRMPALNRVLCTHLDIAQRKSFRPLI